MNLPNPEDNPLYDKNRYSYMAVYGAAKTQLSLFLSEGATLHEAAQLAGLMQQAIHAAYSSSVQDVSEDIAGPIPPTDFSPDNPFNEE